MARKFTKQFAPQLLKVRGIFSSSVRSINALLPATCRYLWLGASGSRYVPCLSLLQHLSISISYIPGKGTQMFRCKSCEAHFGGLVTSWFPWLETGTLCAKGWKTHHFSTRTRWYLHVLTAAYWAKKTRPRLHGICNGIRGHLKQTFFLICNGIQSMLAFYKQASQWT